MQALKESQITMPQAEAREKVAEYLKSVRARHSAEDAAILRGYRALAKGHTIIDLPKCIRLGGVFQDGSIQQGLPRLAVATASHEFVWVLRHRHDGAVTFLPGVRSSWGENRISAQRRKDVYRCPAGTLSLDVPSVFDARRMQHPWDGSMRAMVPHIPPALRPATSLDGYAVLFEVEEWAPDPTAPSDPALLKHIGGDLYAVLATWDLSPLEQSVLNGRIR